MTKILHFTLKIKGGGRLLLGAPSLTHYAM